MDRQCAPDLLSRSKPELQARFGVTRLALFGSTARDTARSGSDVDVLVASDGPSTSKRYFGVPAGGATRAVFIPRRPGAGPSARVP
ncbi:DNA polymerase subunit beta [Ectothiorhodospira haloalkaliphila]|uniref:DNA polymerase subunit beta n=1 Tax=Ectothiorhodospira haloalkaliphila TaxID=421628 RepID=W8L3Z2_9GAMM|nr:DNA polymerase subunit beta [Ectothiorhodospira haloalkaliphila]